MRANTKYISWIVDGGLRVVLRIARVEIQGFLDQFALSTTFEAQTNFIIGRNGTGKTTLINLIRACLECDSSALVGIAFRSVAITFASSESRNRPKLTILKANSASTASPGIEYSFRESAEAEPLRAKSTAASGGLPSALYWDIFSDDRPRDEGLEDIRKVLPRVVWLSIYRGPIQKHRTGLLGSTSERSNPIDEKMNDIVVSATKYLSSLDKRYSDLLENFQKKYFLSLLNASLTDPAESYPYDLAAEQESVKEISNEIFSDKEANKTQISAHFSKARTSVAKYQNTKTMNYSDAISIGDTIRLHRLIADWQELKKTREGIYSQKSLFEKMVSEMLVNKDLQFNTRNQPIVKTEAAPIKEIELADLSSGEKQLFIMFGSAPIQEDQYFIFLADEPELSLHIEWQRALVSNLSKFNKDVQIIFATHSPDIVAQHTKRVIRMEKLLSKSQ
jgi:predicted ATP-dependent endonuclease of OLD family